MIDPPVDEPTRRRLLGGAVGLGARTILAGCGADDADASVAGKQALVETAAP